MERRPENISHHLRYTKSDLCTFLKVCSYGSQVIDTDRIVVFEAQKTSYRLCQCLVEITLDAYIAGFSLRSVSFGRGHVG